LGLTRVDRGSGQVLGMDFRHRQLDIRRAVGFVPEDECLFPHVVGVEFVTYAGELVGMSSKDAMQRSHEVLDYVGLGEARYRKVESYSTGMKQRLKLASAIVHDPQLLILDEPTNGMDPRGREDLLELARDLVHNKGMSLLFSSHLLPDVESVCEEIIVLGRGKLLTEGNIQRLKQLHNRSFEVRLKADARPFAERLSALGCGAEMRDDSLLVQIPEGRTPQLLWEVAAQERVQIRNLRPQRSTLEEVFLKALEQA
jgi:ABC-2 type transport system ATP-binding protein